MNLRSSNRLVGSFVLVLILCTGFGVWQNAHGGVGGGISPAKILWLSLAIGCFFVVPACLWRDPLRSRSGRQVWGGFLLGFGLRAVIELPMLAFTRAWRCEYGIAHDAGMLLYLGIGVVLRVPREDTVTRAFAAVVALALLAEMLNALLFSRAADPRDGVYFASEAREFATINRVTWFEITVLAPLLAGCAWMHRKEAAA